MLHSHFIMHKPYGYLCQFVCDLKRKKLVKELYEFSEGTMAIGRLDEHSEVRIGNIYLGDLPVGLVKEVSVLI